VRRAAGQLVLPVHRHREVGHRRVEPERVPARDRRERADRGRLRRKERRLLPLRREDRRPPLEHTRRPGRRPGRLRVGLGLRRPTHLRLAHEPAPHPLQPDRERPADGHDRHGRLVGRSTRRRERSSGRPPIRRPRRSRPGRSESGTSRR
jgi:hypothetical protein